MKLRRLASWPAAALTFVALLTALAAGSPEKAIAGCIARAAASASPSPSPSEAPLYAMGDDIYTIDHDATLFYYFQGNRDGTAKVKKELRYDRNLWNTCAQLQIRFPFITKYPTAPVLPYSPNANPYSGFGNLELRYLYSVPEKTFDHTIAVGVALPTQANGVESIDTQLKLFYITKWKWNGGSLSSTNEYDQTVIRPPGASNTSYYEQEIALPYWSFVDSPAYKGLKFSASYTGRVFFNDGSIYKSAIGGIINGSMNDVALSLRDTWGIGANGLWKYKVEANATARLNF
ncbi:MAG: hypothetical protein WAL67_10395 [Candidatus Cybelea sp.]